MAFTVRAMDAGPVLAQQPFAVDGSVQAPELLHTLFDIGTDLLLKQLPIVWEGQARDQANPQVMLLLQSTPLYNAFSCGQHALQEGQKHERAGNDTGDGPRNGPSPKCRHARCMQCKALCAKT